jgi:hypothetical protein
MEVATATPVFSVSGTQRPKLDGPWQWLPSTPQRPSRLAGRLWRPAAASDGVEVVETGGCGEARAPAGGKADERRRRGELEDDEKGAC